MQEIGRLAPPAIKPVSIKHSEKRREDKSAVIKPPSPPSREIMKPDAAAVRISAASDIIPIAPRGSPRSEAIKEKISEMAKKPTSEPSAPNNRSLKRLLSLLFCFVLVIYKILSCKRNKARESL